MALRGPSIGTRLSSRAAGKPNPVGIVAAIVAAGLTGKLMQDAYHGHKPQIEQDIVDHETKVDFANTEYGFGHWSGFRTMDHYAHKWFGFKMMGPGGLFITLSRWKMEAKGFIKGVIGTNLIPIGITLAALFAGMGSIYRKKTVDSFRRTGTLSWDAVKAADIPQQLSKVPGGINKATRWTLRGLFAHGMYKFTLPILGVLGFGAYRFNRVLHHEQQHDFFDDGIVTVKHH